ncbi:hypothetical protein ABPG74_011998 [Tetrahymena malaccensis]
MQKQQQELLQQTLLLIQNFFLKEQINGLKKLHTQFKNILLNHQINIKNFSLDLHSNNQRINYYGKFDCLDDRQKARKKLINKVRKLIKTIANFNNTLLFFQIRRKKLKKKKNKQTDKKNLLNKNKPQSINIQTNLFIKPKQVENNSQRYDCNCNLCLFIQNYIQKIYIIHVNILITILDL